MRIRSTIPVLLTLAAGPASAFAGFEVSSWNLTTHLTDWSNASSPITDSDDILTLSNPLIRHSQAQVGPSFTTADYDYSWLSDMATGHFNTTLTHAIRAPEIRSVSTGAIFIFPSEDIRVTVSGLLNYSHTPGDDFSVDFFGTVRNIDTSQDVFNEHREGGNLYLLPSSGTLSFHNETTLNAGTLYRLRYGLDTSNTADLLPTGILDATGYVNFTIGPVAPEPATLSIAALVAWPFLLQRRRQRQPSRIPNLTARFRPPDLSTGSRPINREFARPAGGLHSPPAFSPVRANFDPAKA